VYAVLEHIYLAKIILNRNWYEYRTLRYGALLTSSTWTVSYGDALYNPGLALDEISARDYYDDRDQIITSEFAVNKLSSYRDVVNVYTPWFSF
jgi:hypothetical protein